MDYYKYYCDKCKVGFSYKSQYNIHCKTSKHLNEKKYKDRLKREVFVCESCKTFKTRNKNLFSAHLLSYHSTSEERKNGYPYYCDLCDIGVFHNSLYEKHLCTSKHKKRAEIREKEAKND